MSGRPGWWNNPARVNVTIMAPASSADTVRSLCVLSVLTILALCGCTKYVPVNLPLAAEGTSATDDPRYRDDLGRSMGGADADGPQYRITMVNGVQFTMKAPRIVGDSVVGYYRPAGDESWARASIDLYEMRVAEEKTIDWVATASLMITPITLRPIASS